MALLPIRIENYQFSFSKIVIKSNILQYTLSMNKQFCNDFVPSQNCWKILIFDRFCYGQQRFLLDIQLLLNTKQFTSRHLAALQREVSNILLLIIYTFYFQLTWALFWNYTTTFWGIMNEILQKVNISNLFNQFLAI